MKYVATVNGASYTIEIGPEGRLEVNGKVRHVNFLALDDRKLYSLLVDNSSYEALVQEEAGLYDVLLWGALYEVSVMDEREQRLSKSRAGFVPEGAELLVRAPMPGMIIEVRVKPGDVIEAGQTLVILESMKMENELKAPRAGTIGVVHIRQGDNVEANKSLVTLT
ncbi:MAG: biotin/lipoyl-binding protein [Anaerolineae bacterium]|nr:biotin/lipoyl-binding protein [Anaerolineae bacterium]